MRGFVYVSEASVPFDRAALGSLATEAAARNKELEVTGYLFFDRARFILYIEGEGHVIEPLAEKIERDPRHRFLNHVFEDDRHTRLFPAWSMRWVQRRDLMQLRLEHVLSDHLLFIGRTASGTDSWRATIWSMVHSLADMSRRYPF